MQPHTKDERLSKRSWLIQNLDDILRESAYHKAHKLDFAYEPPLTLWKWGEEKGSCKLDYVD